MAVSLVYPQSLPASGLTVTGKVYPPQDEKFLFPRPMGSNPGQLQLGGATHHVAFYSISRRLNVCNSNRSIWINLPTYPSLITILSSHIYPYRQHGSQGFSPTCRQAF